MPFRRLQTSLALIFVCLVFSACGEKKAAVKTLLPERDMGCFDRLGDRVSRFFNGTIEEPEWQSTFDCVNDQITFFKKYVRGNTPEGYDQGDIAALVRKFLIVNVPVSDAFIASIFEIKASVFGGSPGVITPNEIDEFLRLSEVLRTETKSLLPYLREKRKFTSRSNLIELSDRITVFGDHLASYLRTLNGSISVRKESFIPFIREILALHGGDPSLVNRYGDFVRNLKVVVSGGSPDVIEAKTWPTLVQKGSAFGGLLLAYRDMEDQFSEPGDKDRFMVSLADRAQIAVNQVLFVHGGRIPLEVFDPVVDTAPWVALNPEKREALKHSLRPIIANTLKGGEPGWLTPGAVATLFDLFKKGMNYQILLKNIYRLLPSDPKTKEFEAAARDRRIVSSENLEEVNTLIELAKSYVGLYPENSNEMVFTSSVRESRTLNHMIRMSWYRLGMQHLFSVYATGPEKSLGRKTAKVEDLIHIIQDFNEILLSWKMSAPDLTITEMAQKRFSEANLFTPVSNGDTYMDDAEGTYYLGFLMSSGGFSGRIFRGITQNSRDWSACPIVGVDLLGQDAVEADCFRKIYYGHPDFFWANYPGLQKAYLKMSSTEREEIARSMEIAARRGGYSDKPIGPYDVDSLAALPHYVEDLVERFDVNNDEILDKSEILESAYPIFKEKLAQATHGTRSDFLLKGILTYIVKYGKAPPNTLALLAWCAELPFRKVFADRASLYRIVALLSSPLDLDKNTTGSSWPGDATNLFPTLKYKIAE